MYFPILPTLKFDQSRFLELLPKTVENSETMGTPVNEQGTPNNKGTAIPEPNQNTGSWINLRTKGMQAWLKGLKDSHLRSGDQVMVKSGRNPQLFGETWEHEWAGPYVVGHTTDT